jgi:Flp pilus assembly protein TadB
MRLFDRFAVLVPIVAGLAVMSQHVWVGAFVMAASVPMWFLIRKLNRQDADYRMALQKLAESIDGGSAGKMVD